MGVHDAGVPHHPTVELESAHTVRSQATRFPIVLSFLFQDQQSLHEGNMRTLQVENSWNWIPAHMYRTHTHTHTHTHKTWNFQHPALSFLKYFKEKVVNHGWSVTGELQSAGRSRVAMVGLVQQAVDVSGQAGRGAHSVIPQHVDHIVQSVQSVLHLRLQTAGGNKMIVTDCLKFLLSSYPLMSSELNKDGIFGFTNCHSKIYSQTAVFVPVTIYKVTKEMIIVRL